MNLTVHSPAAEYPTSSSPTYITFFNDSIEALDFGLLIAFLAVLITSLIVAQTFPLLDCCLGDRKERDPTAAAAAAVSDIGSGGPAAHGRAARPPKAFLERVFYRLGLAVGRHPGRVIIIALVVTGCFSAGISLIDIQEDPVKLWVPPSSEALQEKDQSDAAFGAFYRTEQIFVSRIQDGSADAGLDMLYGPILSVLNDLEIALQNTTAVYDGQVVTFDQLCNRPIPSKGCILESPTIWFTFGPPITPELDRAAILDMVSSCSTNPVRAQHHPPALAFLTVH